MYTVIKIPIHTKEFQEIEKGEKRFHTYDSTVLKQILRKERQIIFEEVCGGEKTGRTYGIIEIDFHENIHENLFIFTWRLLGE
jgi:hypothetical protein